MASNPFREITRKEFEEPENEDDDEQPETMTVKVNDSPVVSQLWK
jgi:hypothetical protein